MYDRRVTILVGHFGSGKTEVALNGALDLAEGGTPVTMVDLDVVKPYFRSRSARALLQQMGIDLLVPHGDNIFGDLPIIVPEIRGALRDGTRKVVMDVGGDDTGARVLGSLSDVMPVDETHCLLVLNFRRPFTPTVEDAVTMIRGIDAVSRLPVTGIVSNTHLMGETTPEVIMEGYRMAEETARTTGVPVLAVTAEGEMAQRLDSGEIACPIVPLRRIVRPPFEKRTPEQRASGPLFVLN